jgi:hypothetical protein
MCSADVDSKIAAGAGGVEVGVVSLYEACLDVNPPHFQYAARTLSIACEELGGTEGHIAATASLILALEFLYLSTTHYSLKNAFECFEFCLRIESMLRVHSTALIEEMMEGEASSGSHSSSPTGLLEYSRTIKQKALDLISSHRGKSRSSTNSSSSRSAADGDSNEVDRKEARVTSHADLFLGSHLVPFLIELGISWLFSERRQYDAEPSISVDISSTAVHPEAEVVAAVDASQSESVHYADTSYDDDDPSRSKTHGLLLSKKTSSSSAVTSEVLRERVEGSAHRYLAMEALELEYGASTVGRVICQPTTGAVATAPPHKKDGFVGGGGGGADAVRHRVCSRGLTLSLVVIIIRDLLCCEYQFFTAAVVITMFCRNRCFQESVLSLLLQMYADEGILNNDEHDDGSSSSRHSQTIIDSDSTRGGRYSADEKLRRILHVFGLTSIVRRRMRMKEERERERDEYSSQLQVEGMSVQLLLLRAVSPQYIRRVVVEAAAHTHTHNGAGAVSTGGGYFELMPLSDHHHHPLHADLAGAAAAALEPSSSSSYSLLSLLKCLVVALLLVRDRDTASLLLRTISIYITAKVDPSLHLALSMDSEEHTSNEAILRALL